MTENTPIKYPGMIDRVLAFIVDMLTISVVGGALTFPLSDLFEKHPYAGEWTFLLVTLVYFTVLDSNLTNYRTFGRKVVGNELVGQANISPLKAFARKFLVLFPLVNGIIGASPLMTNENLYPVTHPIFFGFIGLGVVGIYFTVLFSKQKVGFHDWIFETRVVRRDQNYTDFQTGKLLKAVWVISFLAPMISILITWANIDEHTSKVPVLSKFEAVQETLEREGLGKVNLKTNTFKMNGTDGEYTRYSLIASTSVPRGLTIEEYKPKFEAVALPILRDQFSNEDFDVINLHYTKLKFYGFFPIKSSEKNPHNPIP